MSFFKAAVKPAAIASLVCSLTLSLGCTRDETFVDYVPTDIAKSKVDDLARSIDFVKSEVRFEQAEFISGVTNGLNRWASYSKDKLIDSSWAADATVQPLVEQYAELPVSQRLGELNFLNTDSYYLQQSYWISLVSDRMAASQRYQPFELYRLAADNMDASKSDKPVDEIFKQLNGIDNADDAQHLAESAKVFDWICRNINLESDAPIDESEIEDLALDPDKEGAAAGVPGLGYQRYPWQTMLYGRGDYVERAKLMMLMLRHLQIDSVMLAAGETAKPWAVAVNIGGDYFLFDTKLGLPIPGEKLGSIATLAMVQKNPKLLTSLDLTTDESLADNTKYWIRPDDLNSLTALLYASPDAASKRMKALQGDLDVELRKLTSLASNKSDTSENESSLQSNNNRMLISCGLDQTKERLTKVDGVTFEPWDIAFKTHQYRGVIRTAIERGSSEDEAKLGWFYRTEAYVNGFRPYRTARGRFFKAKFQVVEDKRSLNALQGWKNQMFSDDDIGNLSTDADMQRIHGIRQENQNSQAFANTLASVQSQMRLIRIDAKLFMAQSLFDNANEGGIRGWLEDLKANSSDDPFDDNGRWNDAVNYLLSRSFESQKLYDEAIEIYQQEGLNQSHGNILRSRLLKQLIKKYYVAE